MTRDVREHSIMISNLAYDEGREFGSKTRPAFVLKYDNEIISYSERECRRYSPR